MIGNIITNMIETFNPWWKGKEHIAEDEDFRKWNESKVKWIPKLAEQISLKPFSLHFVFGPRQVGKTTLIKLLINSLLEEGVDPKAIFYLRCDYLGDYKELMEALEEYFEFRKIEGIESSYIFLDEITFPKDWFRAIKLYIDMGKTRNDVLVLTGSLSMHVKGEAETFPGRRGRGKDFTMYPLSFREFIKVANEELYNKIEPLKELNDKEIREKCFKLMPWSDEIYKLFEMYLKSGGFPLAVKSILENGFVKEEVYETYLSWIRGDLARLYKNESTARRIIKALLEKIPSPLSWHTIAKEIEVGSHKTVFYYIDLLEKMFILKVLPYLDPNNGEIVFRKEKKIHFIDPLFYKMFSRWCLIEEPEKAKIVESVVASHLARKHKIGYWKNGTEIDVVVKENMLGFEVKWKRRANPSKVKVGKIKNVVTLSKNQYSANPLMVPAPIFLACLNV